MSFLKPLYILIALSVITVVHFVFAKAFEYSGMAFDENFFLWEGFALGKGLIPYKEFQEFKPPMIFVMNMLAIKFFGVSELAYRFFFTLFSWFGFLAVGLALMSRMVSKPLAVTVTLLLCNHFFTGYHQQDFSINNSESLGVVFFLFSISIVLSKSSTQANGGFWRQFLGGAVMALSPLSKEPFLFPSCFALLTLALLEQVETRKPRAWFAFLRNASSGGLAVGVLWISYMWITGSIEWYLLQLRETLIYSKEHNVLYGVFPSNLSFWEKCLETGSRLSSNYFNIRILPFVPYGIAVVFFGPKNWIHVRKLGGLCILTFAAGLYAVTIGNGFFRHYFIIAMTGTFFVGILGTIFIDRYLLEKSRRHRTGVIAVFCVLTLIVILPRFVRNLSDMKGYFPQEPKFPPGLLALIQARTSPQDRILNIGLPGLYVFSNRLGASRMPYMHDSFIHIYPGSTDLERFAPYRAELDMTVPKLIIFSESEEGRKRHFDGLLMPFIRDHHYKAIPGQNNPVVYERP